METKSVNIHSGENKPVISKKSRRWLEIILILSLLMGYVAVSVAQTGIDENNTLTMKSTFQPTIKNAIKFSDVPEIKDSVKRIDNIKYGIASQPLFPKYQVQTIEPAKMQNEPLPKLYRSLLKVGYGPLYNMPYGEFWIGNRRDRERNYGAHIRHLSSTTHLKDVGYGGYSENDVNLYGKQFYKKHTLSGDFNYSRNVVHYYGFDTSLNKISDNNYTRQRYQLFEPKVRLMSHYTDSTHLNHDIGLSYYNLSNLNREVENNVKLDMLGTMFVSREKLNVGILTDFYNHKQANDTLNDLIFSLSPSFEAQGEKWRAEVGLTGTLDNFKDATRFYVYPKITVQYDVYESMIIPYAGITGGLIKNSMRSLTTNNPFVDTTLRYTNTNNKLNATLGLKGNISSNTSYDAKVSYSILDSLQYYMINYNSNVQMYNQFDVVYDNTSLLTVGGQLKYAFREKWNLIAKGNYYMYSPKNLARPYQKPDFDLTFTGIYNLQSKIILKADIFVMGKQWAYSQQADDTGATVLANKQIKGWVDANLEAEYRYSKMLSFFARVNNIANQRYYRWDRYPSQKIGFMVGLTFVPF